MSDEGTVENVEPNQEETQNGSENVEIDDGQEEKEVVDHAEAGIAPKESDQKPKTKTVAEKVAEYVRPESYPRLLQQEDFLFSSVYLPPGGLHTREDGSMGFHIEMEQFDGNLGFVPIRSKIVPHYVQLRKALEKTEDQMMKTNENISNVKKQLEDPELDEDLRDEIEAEVKELQRKKRLEYAKWKKISKELDEDEEKGQCVYYSLCDTEGRKVSTDDIYRHNVKPEKNVIESEKTSLSALIDENNNKWITTPASTFRLYTEETEADAKLIADLEIKKGAIEIRKKARGKLYDLSMF